MNTFVLSSLVYAAVAWPNQKSYEFNAIPVGTPGTTAGYDMGVSISITQLSESDLLTFGVVTGIYPASNKFVTGNIYQSYV
jgi:hypothetical protein